MSVCHRSQAVSGLRAKFATFSCCRHTRRWARRASSTRLSRSCALEDILQCVISDTNTISYVACTRRRMGSQYSYSQQRRSEDLRQRMVHKTKVPVLFSCNNHCNVHGDMSDISYWPRALSMMLQGAPAQAQPASRTIRCRSARCPRQVVLTI